MLGQLQMKMIDIQTSLRKSTTQIDGLKREIQRSKLTDREINTLNTETRMYTSVGRMYEMIPLKFIDNILFFFQGLC
jgi:chaperonin cofactor prefoldin